MRIDPFEAAEAAGGPPSWADNAGHIAFAAFEEGRRIGWCYGYLLERPDGGSMALLYSIDVEEASRRRGVGSALVKRFLIEAAARGASKAWVLTESGNAAARALYESAGGKADGQTMVTWDLSAG